MSEITESKNELERLKQYKYKLLREIEKTNEKILEETRKLESICQHEMVPDRSYVSERTVWVCKICGL